MHTHKRPAFVTGAEFELRYVTSAADIDIFNQNSLCLPLSDRRPAHVAEGPLIKEAQDDARSMLAALTPRDDTEAERLRTWKQQVGDFTLSDAINFRVYEGVSVPSLSEKHTTVGMQYSQVTSQHGGAQLEFRFGTELHQSGYYDNKDVSETRLTPKASEQYESRRQRFFERAGRIATAHGAGAYLVTEHINSSVFDGERPFLGDPEQDIMPYRLVTAGLNRLFIDGGLYNPAEYPNDPSTLKVGPWRDSDIRIVPSRLELRTRHGQRPDRATPIDQKQGHRFMLQAIEYGLRYATREDVVKVPVRDILISRPAAGFDRNHDLGLLRYLGGLERSVYGRLSVAEPCSPLKAFGRMAGKRELIVSDKLQQLFVSDLTIQDGHARITAEGLAQFVAAQNPLAQKNWSGVTAEDVNEKLRVISVKPGGMVSLNARLARDMVGPVYNLERAEQSLGQVAPQAYVTLATTYRKQQ